MPPFKLKDVSKRALRTASRQAVRDDLAALHPSFKRRRWLPASNRYITDTIDRLKKDRQTAINAPDLAAYIAASAPLHCADGWAFASRALAALVCGDANAARHMGYYAELRAAMSLLASEGVGVFDKYHYVVPAQGTFGTIPLRPGRELKEGTHVFAWLALDHWSDLQRAANLLVTVIRPGGQTLHDWLSHFMAGQYPSLASKWLKLWGVDLRAFPADREARNYASYRPTRLVPANAVGEEERSAFITALWTLAEPSEPSRFDALDRFLLRQSIHEIFRGVTGQDPRNNPTDFQRHVEAMITATAPLGLSEAQWLSFLTAQTHPATPLLLQEAAALPHVGSSRHHMQVIARAVLLLRLASGACLEALRASHTTTKHLRFWWERFGIDFRLWPEGQTPDQIVDLWADVRDALERNTAWMTANAPTDASRWSRAVSEPLVDLTACERIALWGMGL